MNTFISIFVSGLVKKIKMMNFEELLEEQLNSLCFKPNEIIDATVVEVDRFKVLVDVGLHTYGELKLAEFPSAPSVGDLIKVVVEDLDDGDGNLKITHNEVMVKNQLEGIPSIIENNETVDAEVIEVRNAGLIVKIGYLTGFMPKKQASIEYVDDFTPFLNNVYKVKILSHDQVHDNLIVSHKKYIIDEVGEEIPRLESPVEVGEIYLGKVTGIAPFGLFVDVGSASPVLLHITDIEWDLNKVTTDNFKFGDSLSLKAKSVVTAPNGSQRICMSLKHIDMSPWEKAKAELVVGEKTTATIYKIEDETGDLIVSIGGVPGVIESKDISWTRITNSSLGSLFKRGDNIDVVVKGFENKMGYESVLLSHKDCQLNPWGVVAENYSVGQIIDTNVVSVGEKMLFAKIHGDVNAIVHLSEVDWIQPESVIAQYSTGDQIAIKLLEIDASDRKVIGSIRQVSENPLEGLTEGTPVKAKVCEIRKSTVEMEVTRHGRKLHAVLPARYKDHFSGTLSEGAVLELELNMIMSGTLYLRPLGVK